MKGQFKEPRRINLNPPKKSTLAEATDLVKREEETRQAEQAKKTARLREERLRREASSKE